MAVLLSLVDFVLHIDVHLASIITSFGLWTYVILFLIIVGETGLVIAPILPGDSLLFACGAFAAKGMLHLWALLPLLWLAAVIGDSINYAFGKHLGVRAFRKDARFLNHDHLEQSQAFFRKHGGKSIVLARFLPFVRTFAPFIAGVSRMHYGEFLLYNVVGGALWIGLITMAGFFFGQIPAVQEHFSLLVIGIVGVSVVPGIIGYMRHKFARKTS